jgi:hypothetical protein
MLCQIGGVGKVGDVEVGRGDGGDGRRGEGDAVERGEVGWFMLEEDGRESGGCVDDTTGASVGAWRGAAGAADFRGQLGDLLGQPVVFGFHLGESFEEELVLAFHGEFLVFELLDLETLALSGGLGGGSVAEDALYAALLLFIFCFCPFSRQTLDDVKKIRFEDGHTLEGGLSLG